MVLFQRCNGRPCNASSLRVESGQEKSVYDQSNQSSEEENIDDPNAEINAQLMRMNT